MFEKIEEILGLSLTFSLLQKRISGNNLDRILAISGMGEHEKIPIKKNATKKEVCRVLEIIESGDFVHQLLIMLDVGEDIDQWSVGRIVQTFLEEEDSSLVRLTKLLPGDIDLWKILVRRRWNQGEHSEAIEYAKEAMKRHSEDSWLAEISLREA